MRRDVKRIILMGLLSSILAACAGERPDNLGVQGGRLTDCPGSPNCVSSQATDKGHHIAPFVISDDQAATFARLKETLAQRRDTTIIEEDSRYLRVEFRTTLFVDDGEFWLDGEQGLIHVRSASRLGFSDLGKNRSRLEEIRRHLSSVSKT